MEKIFENMVSDFKKEVAKDYAVEQSFGLCGTGRGWDDLGEWH